MAAKPGAPRRRHSADLKVEVVEECSRPGASVAAIALQRGLNANLVHKWLRAGKTARPLGAGIDTAAAGRFIELQLPAGAEPKRDIQIELRRDAVVVHVTWPVESSAECAGWMRDVLP
jgi:transposase